MDAPVPVPDAWSPLRHPLFRSRWLASIISNIGTWMQDTSATWLMTVLTGSPLLIALMQTAASLPVLVLGLPAGAMADILDRRRVLIFWQTWMLVAAVVLAVVTLAGGMGPWLLLSLTLLLNVGAAMNNPAWQAIVPELVPRSELAGAISLNSAGYNLARAVGPALGGLVMAAFASVALGAGVTFFINALSFAVVIAMLFAWKRRPMHVSALPAERMLGSIRAGARYVRHSQPIRRILVRTFLVTSGVSAMWALLAVVAQQDLARGALGYGLLNASLGTGAILGAMSLARLRRTLSSDAIITWSTIVFAITLLVMAFVHHVWVDRHRAARRRVRVDQHDVDVQHRGADFRAVVGPGPAARHVSDDVSGRHGDWQRVLGVDRRAHEHAGGALDGGVRPAHRRSPSRGATRSSPACRAT